MASALEYYGLEETKETVNLSKCLINFLIVSMSIVSQLVYSIESLTSGHIGV